MCNIRLLCKEMCVQERRASAQYACTFVNAHFTGHVHISHRTRAVGLQTRPGRLLQGDDHRRLHSSRASLLWKEQHLPKWLMALTLRRQAGRQEAGHHNWMSQSRCPCLIYWAGLPSWALWDEGGRKADGGEGLWRKGKRERLRRRKWGSEEKGEANTLNTFLGARGKRKESGKRKGKSCRIIKKNWFISQKRRNCDEEAREGIEEQVENRCFRGSGREREMVRRRDSVSHKQG